MNVEALRERYVEALISCLGHAYTPDLADRIERVLGLAADAPAKPAAPPYPSVRELVLGHDGDAPLPSLADTLEVAFPRREPPADLPGQLPRWPAEGLDYVKPDAPPPLGELAPPPDAEADADAAEAAAMEVDGSEEPEDYGDASLAADSTPEPGSDSSPSDEEPKSEPTGLTFTPMPPAEVDATLRAARGSGTTVEDLVAELADWRRPGAWFRQGDLPDGLRTIFANRLATLHSRRYLDRRRESGTTQYLYALTPKAMAALVDRSNAPDAKVTIEVNARRREEEGEPVCGGQYLRHRYARYPHASKRLCSRCGAVEPAEGQTVLVTTAHDALRWQKSLDGAERESEYSTGIQPEATSPAEATDSPAEAREERTEPDPRDVPFEDDDDLDGPEWTPTRDVTAMSFRRGLRHKV